MTHTCPQCERVIDVDSQRGTAGRCPFCHAELLPNEMPVWTAVARVTNLAEAGFLANDLNGSGIHARVVESESFSALAGRWSNAYVIEVSADRAQEAAAQIRQHLAEEDADETPSYDGPLFSCEEGPVNPVFWRPVVMIVFAGMASFMLGQRFAEQQAPQPQPRNSLPATVAAIGRPFVTEPRPGESRHRLWYHHRHRSWYLETDIDNDGRFDHRQRFHPAGTRW